MPIFARAKLVFQDWCLLPHKRLTINYEGPNPQMIYPQLITLMKEVFGVREDEVQAITFEWTRGKVERFNIEWRVIKDIDKFSYYQYRVRLSGHAQPSEQFGKIGKAKIELSGELFTEYPQDTWWERSMIYEIIRTLWHRIFYQNKRWEYREECKKSVLLLHRRIREFLNLLPQRV
ncbi:MAG: hypothetical protein J7K98_01845 [Candidatus Aenigmarchaeota archaeon]|nr:hypothetical protein [Candidatus Aenigmarchaeota archaeon]